MSWLPKGKRLLLCTVALGTTTGLVLASKKGLLFDNKAEFRRTDSFTSKLAGSFPSSLPLGKVIASYTTNFQPSVKWDSNWDRRDPKSMIKPAKSKVDINQDEKQLRDKEVNDKEKELLKKATPTKTRHLFLIRHGQYELDPEHDKNRILTQKGREQAYHTGKRLAELNYPYTRLVNSTMTRAQETADIVSKNIPNVPRESCDLLREGAPIPPEPPVGNWKPEAWQFYEDGARIEGAFRKYFHRADPDQTEDSYEIIVCHANVIRYFACRALQLPPEAWLRLSLHHASITWVSIRPSGRVSLRTLGDSGHIPADKLSFN